MWICKHCEMQNEDWENECYLCGKPQKEPDPVVIHEEKKTVPSDSIVHDPAYTEVQPEPHDPIADFEFHIDADAEYENYDPYEENEDLHFEDVAPDYQDVTQDDTDNKDKQPDYSSFVEMLSAVHEQEKTVTQDTAPAQEQPAKNETAAEASVKKQADQKASSANGYFYNPFEYTDGEEVRSSDWTRRNSSAEQPSSAQKSSFTKTDADVQTEKKEPEKPPVSDFTAKSVADLNQFLSRIQQQPSDNITEEIRRKQEERRSREAEAQPEADAQQTKAQKRAGQKQRIAQRRQESVTMFSKVMTRIALAVLAVFLLVGAVFIVVGVAKGYAENIPYVIDEAFYLFELQVREVLEAMQF